MVQERLITSYKKENSERRTQIEEQSVINWKWLIVEASGGIVGAIAGHIVLEAIKRSFGLAADYANLNQAAIDDIVSAVGEGLEQQFIKEWLADCESVRSGLLTYSEANNLDTLRITLEPQVSNLARRFITPNSYKGIGGFMIAANLHLLAVKYLAANDTDYNYKETLKRLIEEYANWGEEGANWLLERAKLNVSSSCDYGTHGAGPSGPDSSGRPQTHYAHYYSQWGREKQSFGGSDENLSIYKGQCEASRKGHYDQVVSKAEEERNTILQACSNWRDCVID